MITLAFILLITYVLLIIGLSYGFTQVAVVTPGNKAASTRFSIVVPFRNEMHNLPALIKCLHAQQYPRDHFEVILVDDESDDGYQIGRTDLDLRVLHNIRHSRSPKKDALSLAIRFAKYDWIVTTDADCCMHPQWLASLDSFITDNQCHMVAGPVRYLSKKGFLHAFQQLDLLSLQGATIGSFGLCRPFMCNGANFAYTKDLFVSLGGFEGNDSHAGGDDVFLLQKAVERYPTKVGYLKSAEFIVDTHAENSWAGLFMQRVRWAAKTGSYSNKFGKCCAVIVLSGNMASIAALVLLVDTWSPVLMSALVLRAIADLCIIRQTGRFMSRNIFWYVPVAVAYPFFSTAVALRSLGGTFNWKGRKF